MPRAFVMLTIAALSCACTDRSSGQPSARAAAPTPRDHAQAESPGAPQAPAPPTPAPPAPAPLEEAPPEFPPRAKTPSPPETDADRACQEDHVGCNWTGLCHAREGRCVALSDRDCEASQWCAFDGSCSVTEDRRCAARDEADCARLCYLEGRCSFEGGACVAGSSADCDGPCARSGRCRLYESTVIGGMGRGDASRPDAECVVPADADCAQTQACRDMGLCELAVARTYHGNPIEYACARERSSEGSYLNWRERRKRRRASQE